MRTRILWLILLSMTFTALPVSVRSVAAKPAREDQAASAPPAAKDPKQKDEEQKTRIAPSVDLWDGGSARALAGGIQLISIPALLGGDMGCRLAPVESWPHAAVITLFLPEDAQRHWLTCRYAHAPPPIG